MVMNEIKCIYCGKGESEGVKINESDIIPDSLTNAKIKYKNVCSIEHNNKFSDKFEYKVIKELSFLRNHLNIIGKSKGNKFPEYDVLLKIDGEIYKRKVRNDANLIGNKKIRNEDGSILLGPLDEIKKMKNSDEKLIKTLDLNNEEIIKGVELNTQIFMSQEIYRLVSKIAYEWFCKVNCINGKKDIFNDVINFIVSGVSPTHNDIVYPISDKSIYELLKMNCNIGSHYLYAYISNNNEINVIVSIFGIAMYNVKLCKNTNFKETLFSEEFMLTGKKKFISSHDLKNLYSDILNPPLVYSYYGMPIYIFTEIKNSVSIADKISLLSFSNGLNNINNEFKISDFSKIIIDNYKELVCSSVLDLKKLKRFVKDYNLTKSIDININNSDTEFWFLLYIVFDIGKNSYTNLNLDTITDICKKIFHNEFKYNIVINSDIVDKLKSEILSTNYNQIIINGANIISKL